MPHGILGNVAKHHGSFKKKIMGWGTPPPWTDRQTHVKTLPSRRTTYAGGNYGTDVICHPCKQQPQTSLS